MDTRTQVVSKPPVSTSPAGSNPKSVKPNDVSNQGVPVKVKEYTKGPVTAEYNSKPLAELGCLLSQPWHFVTPTATEQFTRVYYQNGDYIIGPNGPRLGVARLTYAEYTEGKGLHLRFNTGHQVRIQEQFCQVTHLLQESTP